ncbi:MAG: hypothetical protein WC668_00045 [Patescibacteria group bacterium]|jgi:hypothetical protein
MKSKEQEEISKRLFNQINKAVADGNHWPDVNIIKEALSGDAIIAIFCHGCGFTQGLTQEGLNIIAQDTELKLTENNNGIFIGVDRCNLCDDNLENLRIEKL